MTGTAPADAKFEGVLAQGDTKSVSATGQVKLTFVTPGTYFFTSPVPGHCDISWLSVEAVQPSSVIRMDSGDSDFVQS